MRSRFVALLLFPGAVYAQDLVRIRREVIAAQRKTTVPGLSIAIVKDSRVIMAEGFGYADLAKRRKATADTVYPIGSATKSFTGLLAAQGQAENRLSLKDRPTKYLPTFRMKDPRTNDKITIEDLLSHRSGLPRTDLVWYAGDFSREDLLQLVAQEEPTAPLGVAWQYQNLMFLIAGMVEEKAYGMPFETLLSERFFRPLGMGNSAATETAIRAAPTLATGYSTQGKALPYKSIDVVAPAGSIASTANDMAHYVQMLLAQGEFEGKRVFAKEAVAETRKPRIAMSGGAYGLGWMLSEEEGVERVFHGGNIDGYTSLVTLVPEKGVGVVVLSNGDSATLPTQATEIVLDALLPKLVRDKAKLVEALPDEMGAYRLTTPPIEVAFAKQGKTVALIQNGQTVPMELVGPKRYGIQNAIYVTFGERDQDGKPVAKLEQGGFTFLLTPVEPYRSSMTGQALLAQVVEAQGGEEAIRRHARYVVRYHAHMPSDAAEVYGIQYRRDTSSFADYTHLYSLGRRFAQMAQATDAAQTVAWSTFRPTSVKRDPGASSAADLLADVEPWRVYQSLQIVREDKVGGQPTWVLEKTLVRGGKVVDWVAKSDFRVLKRQTGTGLTLSISEFSDFRKVDGLVVPFHIVATNAMGGKVVQQVDSIRFDEYVPEWPWRISE